MNAQTPSTEDSPDERRKIDLRAALIAELGLTGPMVENIYEVMLSMDISFAAAATRLGLVARNEIEEALLKVHAYAQHETETETETGVVETAIKIASNRRIVLRQGERVKPGMKLITAHDPHNPRSERLRALRTELLLRHEGGRGANMIAVVSAGAGEGRSQLSAELAISFAQLGRRTLLVDADMRKPQQHELFDAPNQHGLSQTISHNERPLLHPVLGLPLMRLLTAGPVPQNPLELLSDGRFTRLLADWREAYEFVVLDTPPVDHYADGLAVATLAAQSLLLSRAQHTPFKSTRSLLRRLAATQSKLLGAVVNHF